MKQDRQRSFAQYIAVFELTSYSLDFCFILSLLERLLGIQCSPFAFC